MLELKNISVGYRNTPVIHHVNFRFCEGTIYTLIGKNGSGKSTLLKACAGLLKPQTGNILLDGMELCQYPNHERAQKMSYLAQSHSAPNITVGRLLSHARFPHLDYPKKLRATDWNVIHQALEDTKTTAFMETSLRNLSGGERQRVYLALQFAQKADILLLDEPTTYLDIEYQLMLMELLQRLKSEGRTVIMVLHDLQQALKYSDQILAVHMDGRIQTGTPMELRAHGWLKTIFNVDIVENEYCLVNETVTSP